MGDVFGRDVLGLSWSCAGEAVEEGLQDAHASPSGLEISCENGDSSLEFLVVMIWS